MARDLARQQLWRDRNEECRQSGLSIQAWCLQNELKNTAYHYWVSRSKCTCIQHHRNGKS
jgi:hypothetical protein